MILISIGLAAIAQLALKRGMNEVASIAAGILLASRTPHGA